jgi:hypothetical protein
MLDEKKKKLQKFNLISISWNLDKLVLNKDFGITNTQQWNSRTKLLEES